MKLRRLSGRGMVPDPFRIREAKRTVFGLLPPLLAFGLLLLAHLFVRRGLDYFYIESAVHAVSGWMRWGPGPDNSIAHFVFPVDVARRIYGIFWRSGFSLFYAPVLANTAAILCSLSLLYFSVRRFWDQPTAVLALWIAIGIPSLSRLALSAVLEPIALLFLSLAYYGVSIHLGISGCPRRFMEAGILYCLLIAVSMRPEASFFLLLYAGLLLYQQRCRLLFCGLLILMIGVAMAYVEWMNGVFNKQLMNASLVLSGAHSFLPHRLLVKFFVDLWRSGWWFYLALTIGAAAYYLWGWERPGFFLFLPPFVCGGIIVMAAMMSPRETDRILNAVVFFLSGPMARMLLDFKERSPLGAWRRVVGVLVLSALGYSLVNVPLSPPRDLPGIPFLKTVGGEVQALAEQGVMDLKSSYLLLETDSSDDYFFVLAYSGIWDRFRLSAGPGMEYPSPLRLSSGDPAWGMLVRSEEVKEELERRYGASVAVRKWDCPIDSHDCSWRLYKFKSGENPAEPVPAVPGVMGSPGAAG